MSRGESRVDGGCHPGADASAEMPAGKGQWGCWQIKIIRLLPLLLFYGTCALCSSARSIQRVPGLARFSILNRESLTENCRLLAMRSPDAGVVVQYMPLHPPAGRNQKSAGEARRSRCVRLFCWEWRL